jgi:peptide-methionine (R)-S-oxide reductase
MNKLIVLCGLFVLVLGAVAYSEPSDKSAKGTDEKQAATKTDAKKEDASNKSTAKANADAKKKDDDANKIDWKKIDWKKRLTPLQYYITRKAGTEEPFKNEFWNNFKDGSYKCVSCGLPLFESTSKFESGCGWPSFDKTVGKDVVTTRSDFKLGYKRIEVRCKRCGAHLGHVFDDGPTQTGLRYCMNSAALKFVPVKDALAKDAKKDEAKEPAKDATASDAKTENKPAETTKEVSKETAKTAATK